MLTKDIAQALAGRLDGDGAIDIDRLVHPERAQRPSDLAIAMSAEAAATLPRSKARAVVVSAERPVPSGAFPAVIAVGETRMALAKLTALFDPGPPHDNGIHPTAIVAGNAEIGEGVSIGAYCGGRAAQPHRQRHDDHAAGDDRRGCGGRRPVLVSFRRAHRPRLHARRPGDRARQRGHRRRRFQLRARLDVGFRLHRRRDGDAGAFAGQRRDRRRRGDRRLHHDRSRHARNRRGSAAAARSTTTCISATTSRSAKAAFSAAWWGFPAA